MKRAAAFLAGALALIGVATASAYELSGSDEGLTVKVTWDGDAPSMGAKNATVTVLDEAGAPVQDARVRIYYGMKPMHGMAPMSYKVNADPEGDVYRAMLNFTMRGEWDVTVRVKTPTGDRRKVELKLDLG